MLDGLFDFTDLPPKERKPLYFITNGLLRGDKVIYTKEIVKSPLALSYGTRQEAEETLSKRNIKEITSILNQAEQSGKWIRFEKEITDIF